MSIDPLLTGGIVMSCFLMPMLHQLMKEEQVWCLLVIMLHEQMQKQVHCLQAVMLP